jgi:hypothetical protein
VAQLPHVRPTFTKRVTEEEKHKKKKNISPLPPAVKEEVKRGGKMSTVGFEPTPGEPDCDLNAAP